MFHRYVDHNGQKIDYDRASWLMDNEVFDEALSCLQNSLGQTPFDFAVAERNDWPAPRKPTPEEELQALWNNYCIRHERKYGTPFNPDVM